MQNRIMFVMVGLASGLFMQCTGKSETQLQQLNATVQNEVRLCPLPGENDDSFLKWKFRNPFLISVSDIDFSASSQEDAKNPILSLKILNEETKQIEVINLPSQVKLSKDEYEYSLVNVISGAEFKDFVFVVSYSLSNANTDLSYASIYVSEKGNYRRVGFKVVNGNDACDQDSQAGMQPGTVMSGQTVTSLQDFGIQTNPVTSTIIGLSDFVLSVTCSGRMSFGMFEKTFFSGIDACSLDIPSVVGETIAFKKANHMLYAPTHHNFEFEYLFDLDSAENLQDGRHVGQVFGARFLKIRSLSDAEMAETGLGYQEGSQKPLSAELYAADFSLVRKLGFAKKQVKH